MALRGRFFISSDKTCFFVVLVLLNFVDCSQDDAKVVKYDQDSIYRYAVPFALLAFCSGSVIAGWALCGKHGCGLWRKRAKSPKEKRSWVKDMTASNVLEIGPRGSVSSYVEAQMLPVRPHLQESKVTLNLVRQTLNLLTAQDLSPMIPRPVSSPEATPIFRPQSTTSDITQMLWNVDNLPVDADATHMVSSLLDHQGGTLKIPGTGVSLTVPPDAIPCGRLQGVYIAITKGNNETLLLKDQQSLLSPVVICGPNGMKFDRPVLLTLPHCAQVEHKASPWNFQVYYDDSEAEAPSNWRDLDSDNTNLLQCPGLVCVEPRMCHIMVDHFTKYGAVGEPSGKMTPVKRVKILAYFTTPPTKDSDCHLRVYCVDDTKAAVQAVHEQETRYLNGTMADAPQVVLFKNNEADLEIRVADKPVGWQAVSQEERVIPYCDIYEGLKGMLVRTFVYAKVDPAVQVIRCRIEARQAGEGARAVELFVSVHPKAADSDVTALPRVDSDVFVNPIADDQRRASDVCETSWPVFTGDIYSPSAASSSGVSSPRLEENPEPFAVPERLRSELVVLLDPVHSSDWRVLAENMGLTTRGISFLRHREQQVGESPTWFLLSMWERRAHSLVDLAQMCRDIGREDAVEILEGYIFKETEV